MVLHTRGASAKEPVRGLILACSRQSEVKPRSDDMVDTIARKHSVPSEPAEGGSSISGTLYVAAEPISPSQRPSRMHSRSNSVASVEFSPYTPPATLRMPTDGPSLPPPSLYTRGGRRRSSTVPTAFGQDDYSAAYPLPTAPPYSPPTSFSTYSWHLPSAQSLASAALPHQDDYVASSRSTLSGLMPPPPIPSRRTSRNWSSTPWDSQVEGSVIYEQHEEPETAFAHLDIAPRDFLRSMV